VGISYLERTHSKIRGHAVVIAAVLFMQVAIVLNTSKQVQAATKLSAPLAVKISQLINDPYAYVDKLVTIVGAVGDVCPARGCWADIIDGEGSLVRFKVPDGEFVFTAAMAGDHVTATGVFRAYQLDANQAIGWLTHLAAERGEVFDPDSHTRGLTVFQLEGDQASLNSEVHSL
jgi:hypothetical protein